MNQRPHDESASACFIDVMVISRALKCRELGIDWICRSGLDGVLCRRRGLVLCGKLRRTSTAATATFSGSASTGPPDTLGLINVVEHVGPGESYTYRTFQIENCR